MFLLVLFALHFPPFSPCFWHRLVYVFHLNATSMWRMLNFCICVECINCSTCVWKCCSKCSRSFHCNPCNKVSIVLQSVENLYKTQKCTSTYLKMILLQKYRFEFIQISNQKYRFIWKEGCRLTIRFNLEIKMWLRAVIDSFWV